MQSELIELVKYFEGFHKQIKYNETVMAVPYICPAGYWTIGYGSLCNKDHAAITIEEGEALLDKNLTTAQIAVISQLKVSVNSFQLSALTSFVFNLGSGRFKASTMRAKINRGEFEDVPNELRKWVYGGGKKLKGLVVRREAEILLWNKR